MDHQRFNGVRVLQLSDLEAIQYLEKKLLQESQLEEVEIEMLSWNAKWRSEQLEHYLPLGWSMGVFDQQTLVGYFLAQPLLFFRGLTQNLWLEHMQAQSREYRNVLAEVLVKTAKGKHFQTVVFSDLDEHNLKSFSEYKLNRAPDGVYQIKTANF